jgi:hypothetical protein
VPLLAGCFCHGCFLGPESEPAPAPLQRGKIWGICRECGCFERFPLFRGKVLLFPAGAGEGQDSQKPLLRSPLLSSALLFSAPLPQALTGTLAQSAMNSAYSLHHALQELYSTTRDEVTRTSRNPIASPARVTVAICELDQQLVPFKNDHQGLLIRANQSSSPRR